MDNALALPKSKLRLFLEGFPVAHLILVCVFSAGMSYATVWATQSFQAEKIDRLEKNSTPREIFDERTKTISDKLEKLDGKLDRILEKP